MNFLLHHHLACAELTSPAAAVGAMLPDLWGVADRRVRPRPPIDVAEIQRARRALEPDERPQISAILTGIEHHLAADQWFHSAHVFEEGLAITTDRFRALEFEADKMVLLAHIAWELCLDGALVRRRGLERLLTDLRRDLDNTSPKVEEAAVELHHFARVERRSDDRAAFQNKMAELRAALIDGGWIRSYTYGGGLSDRLNGIRRRVRLAPLSAADHQLLAEALEELLDDAGGLLTSLLESAPTFTNSAS